MVKTRRFVRSWDTVDGVALSVLPTSSARRQLTRNEPEFHELPSDEGAAYEIRSSTGRALGFLTLARRSSSEDDFVPLGYRIEVGGKVYVPSPDNAKTAVRTRYARGLSYAKLRGLPE